MMPFALFFGRDLKSLVERGEVPLERVDDAELYTFTNKTPVRPGR
jgi:hypothetical protein